MSDELTPDLAATIEEAFARRDRSNMQPTIDLFEDLLAEHPGNPYVLYEVGGSYDTMRPGGEGHRVLRAGTPGAQR